MCIALKFQHIEKTRETKQTFHSISPTLLSGYVTGFLSYFKIIVTSPAFPLDTSYSPNFKRNQASKQVIAKQNYYIMILQNNGEDTS